ncbi:MAG: cold-shock protein, partial [Flavobacteriales bacterium]
MNLGVVKFFDETKGFGFIKGENGEEVFVHV